jgi:hypothetical protein
MHSEGASSWGSEVLEDLLVIRMRFLAAYSLIVAIRPNSPRIAEMLDGLKELEPHLLLGVLYMFSHSKH